MGPAFERMKLIIKKPRTNDRRLEGKAWPAGRLLFFLFLPGLIAGAMVSAGAQKTESPAPSAPGRNTIMPSPKDGLGFDLLNYYQDLMDERNGRGVYEPDFPGSPNGSPIQVTRATNGTFTVENHFCFTDARACKFSWQLWKFPLPGENNFRVTVLRSGVLDSPAIPPGEKGILKISAAAASPNADALALRVDDPRGRELATRIRPLKSTGAARLADGSSEQHAIPYETNGAIVVQTGDLTVTFSRQTGRLAGVRRGAQNFSLTNGPRPAMGGATLREIHFDDDGPDAIVAAQFDGDLKFVLWRIFNNGWVKCRCTYAAPGTNLFSGVLFDYPENQVRHKRWVGDGPGRVWKNRLKGVTLGAWENDYPPLPADGRDGINPEFKGFFANMDWLQLDTTEGSITVVPENVPFVQVLTPEFPPPELAGKACAPVPKCGLGFLDTIPSLSDRFQAARCNDPPGRPDATNEEYNVTVDFYFGGLNR
jgi:hypothetical protein